MVAFSPALDRVMAAFTARGEEPRKSGKGWVVRCPAHDDKTASLSVGEGHDGRVLFKCHAGCSFDDICRGLGLGPTDLFAEKARVSKPPARETSRREWAIHSPDGALFAQHVRVNLDNGSKRFLWRRGDEWNLGGLKSSDVPLYGSELLATTMGTVVLTEGEKAADAVRSAGLLGLGTVTGAEAVPSDQVLACLAGRDVALWPDNDKVGHKHMRLIAEALMGKATVRVIETSAFAAKADAADFKGDMRALVENAKPFDAFADEPEAHSLDDLGNAARLQAHFGAGQIRVTNVDGAKAEWLVWKRNRWVRGPEAHAELHAASSELHSMIAREQAHHTPKDFRKFLGGARNTTMQAAARTQLRSTRGVFIQEAELDDPRRTKNLIAFADGVYDLRTGQKVPNAPALYITRYASTHVDPSMPTPLWDETLENLATVFHGEKSAIDFARVEFIERAIGISMFGNPARHVFVFDGPSGTAKSTIASTLQFVLGDVVGTVPTAVLCSSGRAEGEAPTPAIAALHGRRFAFSQEATGRQTWNVGTLKSLTSAELIPARGMYGSPFSFVNTADIWLTTNDRPRIPDADAATLARISVFPCDGWIFPRDQDFDPDNPKHRRRAATYNDRVQAEAPGIAAKLLAYAKGAHEHGFELAPCAAVQGARSRYQEESRTQTERFLDDRIAPDPDAKGLFCADVYSGFVRWYRDNCRNGEDVPPQEVVTREIGRIFQNHNRAGGKYAKIEPARSARTDEGGVGRRWVGLRWHVLDPEM